MAKRKIEDELYFRNIVRSRDNWTCQRCDSIEYPQVHHINSVSDYPLFKNLPQYGITLCVYCHADAHPEIPRNLFIANVIKAEKEGCISAGKLAKELNVNPRTIVRKAIKLGILKPMQKWMFTEQEAKIIKEYTCRKRGKIERILTWENTNDSKVILKTSKEICNELNIDRNTLYRWMRNYDNFPCIRIGATWRFELDKVKEWAEMFGKNIMNERRKNESK